MRGRPAPPPDLTPQGVSVAVNLALRGAGFRASGSSLDRARYAFAERAAGRAFLVSYKMLSAAELEQVYECACDNGFVASFVHQYGLTPFRRQAERILHGFVVSAPPAVPEPRRLLETRIAEALAEAARAT